MSTRPITRSAACTLAICFAFAAFLSAAFAAPDIRVDPLALNVSRVTNKQIYVEIDWMDLAGDHSHRPSQAVVDRIVETFARQGFDIHIDVSNAIPHQTNINVPNGVESDAQVQAIMNTHFNHRNDPRYYYSIWAHRHDGGTSSGVGDKPGRVHLVTLGAWAGQVGTEDEQVGTFIHEFGHNLGLEHGGDTADGDNYKPNFVSVMNYHFQTTGIGSTLFAMGWANTAAGWNEFGYSQGTLPDLDESHLNETVGIGLGRAVDWNKSGAATETDIKTCIHGKLLEVYFSGSQPSGWTVVDNAATGATWRFDNPGSRTNLTGGSSQFAIADSNNAGSVNMDTELRSPVMNCSTRNAVTFEFRTDFRRFGSEVADVDVSINGAAGPWTNLWRKTGSQFRGPVNVVLDVPQAANKSNVMFRFHYYGANFEWWWQVDDVSVGERKILRDHDDWGGIGSQVREGVLMPSLDAPVEPPPQCLTADESKQHQAVIAALLAQRGPDPGLTAAALAPTVVPTNGFTIFNDGDQDLVVSGITPQTAAAWLSVSPTFPMTIPAGGSRTVAVAANFTLAPDGTTTTRLLVASNDPDENPYPGGVDVTVAQAPNLTPSQPPGWSDKIVISNATGTNTDTAPFHSTDTLYVDFAVANDGHADAAAGWVTELYVDDVLKTSVPSGAPLAPGATMTSTDVNIGTLTPGSHTIRIKADFANAIVETDETDNEYTRTITVVPPVVVSTSGDSGAGSLRDAIANASPGDIIIFDQSLSGATIPLGTTLSISKNLTIDASSLAGGLTLSGGGLITPIVVNSGFSVSLTGLTVANGFTDYDGGGIFNAGALTLTRCTFTGNSTGTSGLNLGGGAILNYGGTLAMTLCSFSGNSCHGSTKSGGAVRNATNGPSIGIMVATHCTFSANSSDGNGGGAISNSGTLTLNNCIVAGNTITSGLGTDVNNPGTMTGVGANIVQAAIGSGGTLNGSATIAYVNPRLSPLASNGGPTKTMALQPGSPAVNAAVGSTITGDQRGFPILGTPDIGAYELSTATVTTAMDENDPVGTPGTGLSLREAVRDLPGGAGIVFDPSLSGQTISLTAALGEIVLVKSVTIDASPLSGGLTIVGGAGMNRIFTVNAATVVTLRSLILTGGNTGGNGGAIVNSGTLTAERCTLTANNASGNGGAIRTTGTLTLTDCTLSGNTAGAAGGAVMSDTGSIASFTRCTFSGNTSSASSTGGGAINHTATAISLALTHCTLTANSASGGAGSGGGGIRNRGTDLTLRYCLIAGNTATGTGADVNNTGATLTFSGTNIIPTAIGGTVTGPTPITTPPALGALASNGGPTQTCALLAGSAGINAAAGSAATVDQRGLPVSGTPDLGAYEFGGGLNVTTSADSGPGSLRWALANAVATTGANTITFAPGITGPVGPGIFLGSELAITSDVTLDASGVPGGLTINGGGVLGNFRIFSVASGKSLTLRCITLSNGGGIGFSGAGGAIHNSGTLALTQCTLSGNSTLGNGGAIYGAATLTNCTLANNAAGGDGGAIYGSGAVALQFCTVAGNSSGGSAGGGGVYLSSQLMLEYTIVAGNSLTGSGTGADIRNDGTVTVTGSAVSIVQTAIAGNAATGPIFIVNPRLAPLADNGGPTKTMALLPRSPALDAIPNNTPGPATDQRGFPRFRSTVADPFWQPGAWADIGAYEAQVAPFALGFNLNGAGARILADTDTAGAPGFAQQNWNNLTGNSDAGTTAARLTASGGSATVRSWYESPNVFQFSSPSTPDQKLMTGYLDSSGAANSGTNLHLAQNQPFFALASLPPDLTLGGYKVVVYADTNSTDGRTGEYWLTTQTDPADVTGTTDLTPHRFLKDQSNFSATNTYTRVPASSITAAGAVAGNYLVFENQTQPGFILRTEDATSPRAVISAVQIVRNEVIVVTTVLDENDPIGTPGMGVSLREALRDAPDGAGIIFDSALSGATLALSSEIIVGKTVTIDASSLPSGLTISGANASRILSVSSGTAVQLKALTFTGGFAAGIADDGSGGAIRNAGTLAAERCTFTGNSAGNAGAGIHNAGGTLAVTQCTFTGNTAPGGGGAISSFSGIQVTVTQSTLSANTASYGGGGIYNFNGPLTLTNSIVAANTSAPGSGADIRNEQGSVSPVITLVGANIVQSLVNTGAASSTGPAAITSPPLLAALANYGGPTKTMALLPGSPARNAAVGSLATSDQRGFPGVGQPDLGAYEAGTLWNFNAWAIETTGTALSFTGDIDHDGVMDGIEYATRTSLTVSNTNPLPSPVELPAPPPYQVWRQAVFPYRPGATDVRYIIQRSPSNLAPWTEIYRLDLTNGTFTTTTDVIGILDSVNGTVTVQDANYFPDATFWRLIVVKP